MNIDILAKLQKLQGATPAEREMMAEQLARSGVQPPPPGTFLKAKTELEALRKQLGQARTSQPKPLGVSPAPVIQPGANPQDPQATNEELLE